VLRLKKQLRHPDFTQNGICGLWPHCRAGTHGDHRRLRSQVSGTESYFCRKCISMSEKTGCNSTRVYDTWCHVSMYGCTWTHFTYSQVDRRCTYRWQHTWQPTWQYSRWLTRAIYMPGGIHCHVSMIGCFKASVGFQPHLGHIDWKFLSFRPLRQSGGPVIA
jgi:hypothetical protein